MMASKPSNPQRFRVHYRYRTWIGKPDPSGFGTAYVSSNDYSWLHEYIQKDLVGRGHKVLAIQRFDDKQGKYVTI